VRGLADQNWERFRRRTLALTLLWRVVADGSFIHTPFTFVPFYVCMYSSVLSINNQRPASIMNNRITPVPDDVKHCSLLPDLTTPITLPAEGLTRFKFGRSFRQFMMQSSIGL
jgi:hypothetical protein